MTEPAGFDVSPNEIEAHAKQVQDTTDQLRTSIEAAHSRMGYEDFGLFGVPLGLWCNSLMDSATQTLAEARAAGERHSTAVKGWATNHRVTEESIAALFKGTG